MSVYAADFAPIPAGRIRMRDARTGGVHDVDLEPFSITTTSVRFAEYALFMDAPVDAVSVSRPAHPVSWFKAIQWCNAASLAAGLPIAYAIAERTVIWNTEAGGYRLPTEAEWEWACRAGTTTPTYGPLTEIAWTATDNVRGPQEPALKAPNDFGLYDTIGNVWEWCWNYADPARYGDYRSLRGGGWADQPWNSRASVRRGSAPDAILEDVGFRVARGAVADFGARAAQGWSAAIDRQRADIRGPLPIGWTPLRSLLAT